MVSWSNRNTHDVSLELYEYRNESYASDNLWEEYFLL